MIKTKQSDDQEWLLFRDAFEAVTGQRIHNSTAVRYRHSGVRGVKLRAERFAGKWYTTIAWVREFVAANTHAASVAATRTPTGLKPVATIRRSTADRSAKRTKTELSKLLGD